MKKFNVLVLCLLLLLASCSKKKSDDGSGLSQSIQNFVPQSVIDSMRVWGLAINEGSTPPDITGIYNVSPVLCTYDNSGGNRANTYFDNYRFRFHDQDNTNLTIAIDYKDLRGGDTASGVGSFIAGSGNNFTVFVDQKGISYGISYESIGFYSGIKTSSGIQNFQFAIYWKQKGPDPSNQLVPVGTSRIFKDADDFSESLITY